MTASRSARQRKAAAEAGPLATVRIDVDGQQRLVYKIACSVCTVKDRAAWSAYRPGADNGYMAAMDRWILHLTSKHPDVEAPCLTYLPEARARLQERRDARSESGT